MNLFLCFPALDDDARRQLAKKVFRSVGISLVETANAWVGDVTRLQSRCTINGLAHLQAAVAEGKGVLLLGMHFGTLDLSGALLARAQVFDVMYRPNGNALLEHMMAHGRKRHFPRAIIRDDLRGVIKSLRQGRVLWYGADQDYGPAHSVFAPFMGQSAATITATARIVSMTGARVIVFEHTRDVTDGTYTITLSPFDPAFPTGDAIVDATMVNQVVEGAVMKQPEQYWWIHRRFKSRPNGESRPYLPQMKRIRAAWLEQMQASSTLLQGTPVRPGLLLTPDGQIIKTYYRRRWLSRSIIQPPAMRFARNARELLSRGFGAPVVRAVYYFPPAKMHLLTYDRLPGSDLRSVSGTDPARLQALPRFLAQLHAAGVYFRGIHLGNILLDENRLALIDIADLSFSKRPLTPTKRARNLAHLLDHGADQALFAQYGREHFISSYRSETQMRGWHQRVFEWQLKVSHRKPG